MLTYLYIALGGALGSMARYALSGSIARALNEIFPFGTLIVNVSGCFLIGAAVVLTEPGPRSAASPELRGFILAGFCGGYTTFSSFSLQTLSLLRDGDALRASAYIVGSLGLCLLGVYLGTMAATAFRFGGPG